MARAVVGGVLGDGAACADVEVALVDVVGVLRGDGREEIWFATGGGLEGACGRVA